MGRLLTEGDKFEMAVTWLFLFLAQYLIET